MVITPSHSFLPRRGLSSRCSEHIGAPAKALVKKGDHVKVGQLIGEAGGYVSAPVHASVSGTVVDIQPLCSCQRRSISCGHH